MQRLQSPMHILRTRSVWLLREDRCLQMIAPVADVSASDDGPLHTQAALTLIELYGGRAAEVALEQAEAAAQVGVGAECWRLIAHAIEQGRRSTH